MSLDLVSYIFSTSQHPHSSIHSLHSWLCMSIFQASILSALEYAWNALVFLPQRHCRCGWNLELSTNELHLSSVAFVRVFVKVTDRKLNGPDQEAKWTRPDPGAGMRDWGKPSPAWLHWPTSEAKLTTSLNFMISQCRGSEARGYAMEPRPGPQCLLAIS